jgi:hypothetical protein
VCVTLVSDRPSKRADRECKVSGSNLKGSCRKYIVQADRDDEESAKDAFHTSIPIACLDDYELTYTRAEEYEVVQYYTYKVTRRVLGTSPCDVLQSLREGDYESDVGEPVRVEVNEDIGACTDSLDEDFYDELADRGFIDKNAGFLKGVHSITQLTCEGLTEEIPII